MAILKKDTQESNLTPVGDADQLQFNGLLSLSDKGQSWTFETDRLLSYRLGNKRLPVESIDADVQVIKLKDQVVRVLRSPTMLHDDKGKGVLMYPSDREYWCERALRKMAVQQNIEMTLLAGQGIQIVFTIGELRKELADSGHHFRHDQIKESLRILAGSQFEITCENNKRIHGQVGTLLQGLTWNYATDDADGRKSFVRCHYHPMISQSIQAELHHPINYKRQMGLNNTLASWLVDRINQAFRQAVRPNSVRERALPYHIRLSTILAESGMGREKEMRHAVRDVRVAFTALAKNQYLDIDNVDHPKGWKELASRASTKGRPKALDITFELFLSEEFSSEIIDGNVHKANLRKKTSSQPNLLK